MWGPLSTPLIINYYTRTHTHTHTTTVEIHPYLHGGNNNVFINTHTKPLRRSIHTYIGEGGG